MAQRRHVEAHAYGLTRTGARESWRKSTPSAAIIDSQSVTITQKGGHVAMMAANR